MFKKLLLIIIPFILFSCTSNVDEVEIKKANQFFESIFQDRVLDSPEFQASLGYKSNYDKWDDITWQNSRRKAKQAIDDLAYLRENINFDKLDESTKISYLLMEKRLFYAKYYDSKQEQVLASDLNGSDLTDSEKALVRRHRVGVAGMLGAFTIAIFLIDNSAL